MDVYGHIPIKLYLQKQGAGQDCSLPKPGINDYINQGTL